MGMNYRLKETVPWGELLRIYHWYLKMKIRHCNDFIHQEYGNDFIQAELCAIEKSYLAYRSLRTF